MKVRTNVQPVDIDQERAAEDRKLESRVTGQKHNGEKLGERRS